MNYPTNLLRAFVAVCSWRILSAKIVILIGFTKLIKASLFSISAIRIIFISQSISFYKEKKSNRKYAITILIEYTNSNLRNKRIDSNVTSLYDTNVY